MYSSFCVMPGIMTERNDNIEYNVEDFRGTEGALRKLQFSGKTFQQNIRKILSKFNEEGRLDLD